MMQALPGTSFLWSCHLGARWRFTSADAQCNEFPGAVRTGCFGHDYNWEPPENEPSKKKPKLATSIEQPANFTSNASATGNTTGGAGATKGRHRQLAA